MAKLYPERDNDLALEPATNGWSVTEDQRPLSNLHHSAGRRRDQLVGGCLSVVGDIEEVTVLVEQHKLASLDGEALTGRHHPTRGPSRSYPACSRPQ